MGLQNSWKSPASKSQKSNFEAVLVENHGKTRVHPAVRLEEPGHVASQASDLKRWKFWPGKQEMGSQYHGNILGYIGI